MRFSLGCADFTRNIGIFERFGGFCSFRAKLLCREHGHSRVTRAKPISAGRCRCFCLLGVAECIWGRRGRIATGTIRGIGWSHQARALPPRRSAHRTSCPAANCGSLKMLKVGARSPSNPDHRLHPANLQNTASLAKRWPCQHVWCGRQDC